MQCWMVSIATVQSGPEQCRRLRTQKCGACNLSVFSAICVCTNHSTMMYSVKENEKEFCILTSSVSFTRRICSLRSWRSLKVDCAVMEYTRAKPWPFFMYKSLIAVNCSYTAGKTRQAMSWVKFSGILYTVEHLLQKSISTYIRKSQCCALFWDSGHIVTDISAVELLDRSLHTAHSHHCAVWVDCQHPLCFFSIRNKHEHACCFCTINICTNTLHIVF